MASNTTDLIIGIDSSTTGCKAIAWDGAGAAVAEGRGSLDILHPRPEWHEQRAADWWQAACVAIRQLVGHIDPHRLAAVGITVQRETFVPTDRQGMPLRNAILWMDERASPLLPELEAALGAEDYHRLAGKPLSRNLAVGKIAWLRRAEPRIFEQAEKYLDVHAFLAYRLTGEFGTGWGVADPSGLFDMQHRRWAAQVLELIGIREEQLPHAAPHGEVVGYVTRTASQECGLPVGLPLVAGIGDGQAAALGAGVMSAGVASLSLGTSVILGAFSETYRTHHAFRTLYGGIPGSFIFETALMGGAYTLNWLRHDFLESPSELEEAASQVPAGSQGLISVPYWNSVLSPYWDPAATGVVIGWKGIHRPAHLYRSILEGIAFEQRLNLESMEAAMDQTVERLIVIGGGAQSDLWCQIIADVTGRPVYRSTSQETASLGAAIIAAPAAGWFGDARQAASAMTHTRPRPFVPNPNACQIYSQLYEEVYRPLFPTLQPLLDRLAACKS